MTLTPEQQAAIREALDSLERAETRGANLLVLDWLARRLLEPVECRGACAEWADMHRMWFNERGLLIEAQRELAKASAALAKGETK